MGKLVPPHGSSDLKPLLLEGKAREEEAKKAKGLKKVPITSRETGDLIMLGIGGFTPLDGFMGRDDWKGCCASTRCLQRKAYSGPSPSRFQPTKPSRTPSSLNEDVALWDTENEHPHGHDEGGEKYSIDKDYECKQVFQHHRSEASGCEKVMDQGRSTWLAPSRCFPSPTSRRCSKASTSGLPKRGKCSRSAGGAPSLPCSSATPCTTHTPTWRGSPSRCATASTSISWSGSSSRAISPLT